MKRTKDDALKSRLAMILGTRKSRVEIDEQVEEDETAVVRCHVGMSKYMVVFKDHYDAQVYRRI